MNRCLIVFIGAISIFAFGLPVSAADWTYSFDGKGSAELSGWTPWSHPAGTELVQRMGPRDSVEITSSGSAFAVSRAFDLSSQKGFTIALVMSAKVLGAPDPAISQAYIDVQLKEKARLRFGFFLDALKYGTPPHGGIAWGLDRLIMMLVGTDNIRDVIAFPKTQRGQCLMTEAPSEVDQTQLDELHLDIRPRGPE